MSAELLQADNARLRTELAAAQATIARLEAMRAMYADAGNWYVVDLHDGKGRHWLWRTGAGPDAARGAQ